MVRILGPSPPIYTELWGSANVENHLALRDSARSCGEKPSNRAGVDGVDGVWALTQASQSGRGVPELRSLRLSKSENQPVLQNYESYIPERDLQSSRNLPVV
jgi:hypothetical protein